MADPYVVERSLTVAAAPSRIYPLLADFHRWTAWSPWEDTDPDLRRTYSGAESGTGAEYAWSGNRKAGQGHMQIVEATEPSTVVIDVHFEKPFRSRGESRFSVRPEGGGSSVTWTLSGPTTLMTRVMGLVTSMDRLLGPDLEKGLARLRTEVER